jgi:hypothetical protein
MEGRVIRCEVVRCRLFEQHRPECRDVECSGCLPRPAADGLAVCWPHRDHIEQDARRVPEIYRELEMVLGQSVVSGAIKLGGQRVETGLRLNPRAIASRTSIIAVLSSWSSLIVKERGHSSPGTDVDAMAEFIAVNATWLAAYRDLAGDCVDELHGLVHGEPWRVAHPSDTRITEISPCPMWSCDGMLRAIMRRSGRRPSEIVCSTESGHRWLAHEWFNLAAMMERR